MAYRVLLLIPEALDFAELSTEQQEAIESVFGNYLKPMPGTHPFMGKVICDAVTADNFDPALMPGLGLDWEIIGMWQDDGAVITPLNEVEYIARIDLIDGEPIPIIWESHRWAGWPSFVYG